MPPSICWRIRFGLTGRPQSITHTTRCTRICRSGVTDTSATCATMLPKARWMATPRARLVPSGPSASGSPHFESSATRLSTARWRASLASRPARKATGSLPAATAHSSMKLSTKKPFCECATERQMPVVTADSTGTCATRACGKS
ncbi:hypothetical protein D9M69_562460 [compost metagenome]